MTRSLQQPPSSSSSCSFHSPPSSTASPHGHHNHSSPSFSSLPPFLPALPAGGIAGLAMDVSAFPLDTIKTRLQSSEGFRKAGGFRNLFAGLGPAAIGAVPCAAAFFAVYEQTKHSLPFQGPLNHIISAACGDFAYCAFRTPTDNIKQKLQAGLFTNSGQCVSTMWKTGGAQEFFAGYWATLFREIPFSLIQFPLYERTKVMYAHMKQSQLQRSRSKHAVASSGMCFSPFLFLFMFFFPLLLRGSRIWCATARAAAAAVA